MEILKETPEKLRKKREREREREREIDEPPSYYSYLGRRR